MTSSGSNDVNSWVLSKVLDMYLIGTKEEVDIQRLVVYLNNSIQYPPVFTVGSFGDGFKFLYSDTDTMAIHRKAVVMDTDMCQLFLIAKKYKDILFLREEGCRPGYTTLQISSVRHDRSIKDAFLNSAVPFRNLNLLSSDIYRENLLEVVNYRDCEGLYASNGPSIQCYILNKASTDNVIAFPCVTWPIDAEEWISRTRLFGWPSKAMVNKVVQIGCYIVPIGDKCSEDTLLQWRISFATAERYLVHSFSHTQFQVYGLLKYLLHQIKFRLKQVTGDDDILCSYFMKTVMLFAVENSPHSFWKEENLFICFRFCFSILLDWVHSGYCPNYFIKTNNMFERKIHGENKLKVLNILCELHQMKWMSLHAETGFLPSLWEQMHNINREELLYALSPPVRECCNDAYLMENMYGFPTGEKVTIIMKKLLDSSTDINELIVYFKIVGLLAKFSSDTLQRESNKSVGNKARYMSLKKCKHWLAASFGTDILYLASFHFLVGNYQKALELCRIVRCSVFLDCCSTEEMMRYRKVYCGKGYSIFYKMKQAYSGNLVFMTGTNQLSVPHLDMEVERQMPLALAIPPKEYALFLLFLCHDTLGDKRGCHETLCDLVHCEKYFQGKFNHWVIHTMIGICHQIQGDYRQAIMAYQHSLTLEPKRNPAQERIKALEPFLHTRR